MRVEIKAHITGTVWKITAAVGDEVAEDDTVAILESMKMEMPVESPEDGKIIEILAVAGQSVEEDDVLMILEA